jgi:hypothetical protein
MRLLVLDHYFGQDIAALRAEAGPDVEMRTISFGLLREEALRMFPKEVATGLEAFAHPDLEPERRRWAARTVELLEEQFSIREFDAMVSPSDLFFYVRSCPEACHRLGVPYLVAQKETTVQPLSMEMDAQRVRKYAPPVADHMTVCSERQRNFWLRTGASSDMITVTGQPRFDYYAGLGLDPIDAGYGEGGPVVLFLSYQLDTYHPDYGVGKLVWEDLHKQTEAGLWELAERGWRVLIKPHPQQSWAHERRRLADEVGDKLDSRVFLIDPDEDARRLIAGSNAVVGFQSTALLEAMAAGRPVLYTSWDPESKRLLSGLVPFHEWGDAISVVDAAENLPRAVEEAASSRDPARLERARELAAEHLGVVDGGASGRVLDTISAKVAEFRAARSSAVAIHRAELAERRPPLALGRKARDGARGVRMRLARVLDR